MSIARCSHCLSRSLPAGLPVGLCRHCAELDVVAEAGTDLRLRATLLTLVGVRYVLWASAWPASRPDRLHPLLHALDDVASIAASLHLPPYHYPAIVPELRQALRAQAA